MDYNLNTLEQGCAELGIELTEVQKGQFIQYYQLLVEWNEVMNLTAITDFEEVLLKHFIDSLTISKVIDMKKVDTLIDIGTGAGFPGIPIKIVYPHIQVTLLDSLKKRLKFLNEIIEKLALTKIETLHGRAEDAAHDANYRNHYDLSVSRAVSRLSCLSEYCIPYVRIGGHFVSYKSGNIQEELQEAKHAIHLMGGKLSDCQSFPLSHSDMERSLVVIEKLTNTANKYPRKAGLPIKEPLLA